MLADTFFSMRISRKEKAMIAEIADHLQRSKGDAVKVILRREYEILKAEAKSEPEPVKKGSTVLHTDTYELENITPV